MVFLALGHLVASQQYGGPFGVLQECNFATCKRVAWLQQEADSSQGHVTRALSKAANQAVSAGGTQALARALVPDSAAVARPADLQPATLRAVDALVPELAALLEVHPCSSCQGCVPHHGRNSMVLPQKQACMLHLQPHDCDSGQEHAQALRVIFKMCDFVNTTRKSSRYPFQLQYAGHCV